MNCSKRKWSILFSMDFFLSLAFPVRLIHACVCCDNFFSFFISIVDRNRICRIHVIARTHKNIHTSLLTTLFSLCILFTSSRHFFPLLLYYILFFSSVFFFFFKIAFWPVTCAPMSYVLMRETKMNKKNQERLLHILCFELSSFFFAFPCFCLPVYSHILVFIFTTSMYTGFSGFFFFPFECSMWAIGTKKSKRKKRGKQYYRVSFSLFFFISFIRRLANVFVHEKIIMRSLKGFIGTQRKREKKKVNK